jgi:[ribosomal protein S5]-alanine N-acetyltransferase
LITQLETPRLTLLAFSLTQLETYVSCLPALSKELGFPLLGNPNQVGVARPIQLKLNIMRALPESDRLWVTYWLIILRQEPVGVGLIGFKGPPDALGQVEIGYGIDAEYQNKGLMTEAIRGLAGWAFQQPGCRVIIAEVLKTNTASIRVQQKVGANLVSQGGEIAVYHLQRIDWLHKTHPQ